MIAFLHTVPAEHKRGIIRGMLAIIAIALTVPLYMAIAP